ncbi:MAG: Na/Pi cotransporter family protein [Blautia sp.]|jgi:phosphate:Na+ symporter
MNETAATITGLLGGLALFLYGMNMMSEGLQKAAGEKMKYILGILTKNPLLGVLAGAVTTAVLQSSSATTVMVIGFVSAGLMSLPQAISVILGANIGTTMTAQIIAFNISDYIWPILFLGFVMFFFGKKEQLKNVGQTVFAFGLLFVGIETMGSVMKPLAASPVFTEMIARVSDIPVLGVLLGTVMTLVVQSSSATIAVLQNFASQAGPDGVHSILGLSGAIPILLGDNIGTTITALLACIGQSKNAKRTAVAHSVFNITGAFLFMWIIPWFAKLVQLVSPTGAEVDIISRQIANAHTLFNVINTLIWLPLIWLMVKIVMWIIPGKDETPKAAPNPLPIDDKIMHQPVFALYLASQEVFRCAQSVGEMLAQTKKSILDNNAKALEDVFRLGKSVEQSQENITGFLSNLFSAGTLTENQTGQGTQMMYDINDIEHIGKRCVEIAGVTKEKIEKSYKFSKDAADEMGAVMVLTEEMYKEAVGALQGKNPDAAAHIVEKRLEAANREHVMRKSHLSRVKKGKCDPKLTQLFSNLLQCFDSIGNHCSRLAEAQTGESKDAALPVQEPAAQNRGYQEMVKGQIV